jgi:FkbM family methyltransferase
VNFNQNLIDLNLYLILIKKFGFKSAVMCKRLPEKIVSTLQDLGLSIRERQVSIYMKSYEQFIKLRYQSSDSKVFLQIFVEEEYSCLRGLSNISFIIDAGANVGYSSVYLMNLFPKSRIVAVEPDANNISICEKNLMPYKTHVSILKSAIWSRKAGLVFSQEAYRDGRGWAIRVEEASEGQEPDVNAIDIESILRESGCTSIDLLKMDIERSEIEVFSRNYKYWLDRTKNIVIELHDSECESVFFNAMSDYDYRLQKSGELTVCLDIMPKGQRRLAEVNIQSNSAGGVHQTST